MRLLCLVYHRTAFNDHQVAYYKEGKDTNTLFFLSSTSLYHSKKTCLLSLLGGHHRLWNKCHIASPVKKKHIQPKQYLHYNLSHKHVISNPRKYLSSINEAKLLQADDSFNKLITWYNNKLFKEIFSIHILTQVCSLLKNGFSPLFLAMSQFVLYINILYISVYKAIFRRRGQKI